MILDYLQMFDPPSLPNNLAQAVGTYNSNNVLDYGIVAGIPTSANGGGARDMGIGDDPALKLMVLVSTAFASGGAGTLQVNFQAAPDNGSGAPGAFVTWLQSEVYALAALVVGARLFDIDFPRPPAGVAIPRFCRLQYVIGGATMTAGLVEAGVVLDRFDQINSSAGFLSGYPAGINVAN